MKLPVYIVDMGEDGVSFQLLEHVMSAFIWWDAFQLWSSSIHARIRDGISDGSLCIVHSIEFFPISCPNLLRLWPDFQTMPLSA